MCGSSTTCSFGLGRGGAGLALLGRARPAILRLKAQLNNEIYQGLNVQHHFSLLSLKYRKILFVFVAVVGIYRLLVQPNELMSNGRTFHSL